MLRRWHGVSAISDPDTPCRTGRPLWARFTISIAPVSVLKWISSVRRFCSPSSASAWPWHGVCPPTSPKADLCRSLQQRQRAWRPPRQSRWKPAPSASSRFRAACLRVPRSRGHVAEPALPCLRSSLPSSGPKLQYIQKISGLYCIRRSLGFQLRSTHSSLLGLLLRFPCRPSAVRHFRLEGSVLRPRRRLRAYDRRIECS